MSNTQQQLEDRFKFFEARIVVTETNSLGDKQTKAVKINVEKFYKSVIECKEFIENDYFSINLTEDSTLHDIVVKLQDMNNRHCKMRTAMIHLFDEIQEILEGAV